MAHYRTSIRTQLSTADAFAYVADLRNLEAWDPGVTAVTQIDGDGAEADGTFEVVVSAPGGGMTLRYVTTHFDMPSRAVLEAKNGLFTSIDQIEVTENAGSTVVTYDATLDLNGPLKLFDRILRPAFNRIGDRANAGLLHALDGEPA